MPGRICSPPRDVSAAAGRMMDDDALWMVGSDLMNGFADVESACDHRRAALPAAPGSAMTPRVSR
jgi:hypothetical protein